VFRDLEVAFRAKPGVLFSASKEAKCTITLAKRAWEEGFPEHGLPPIRDQLNEERVLARAKLAEERSKELLSYEEALSADAIRMEQARLAARDEAIESRAQEGQLVKQSRGSILGLFSTLGGLLEAGHKAAGDLQKEILDGNLALDFKQTMKFTNSLAFLTKQATEAAKLNMEMERLLLGEPTEILGVNLQAMSMEDAVRTIGLANRALERARKRGMVPDGMASFALPPGHEPLEVVADAPSEGAGNGGGTPGDVSEPESPTVH